MPPESGPGIRIAALDLDHPNFGNAPEENSAEEEIHEVHAEQRKSFGASLLSGLSKAKHELTASIGGTEVRKVLNPLSEDDIEKATKLPQVGDIILTSTRQNAASVAIGGPLTHSALYIGNGKIIHGIWPKVVEEDWSEVVRTASTVMILRPDRANPNYDVSSTIQFALDSIGKPYDMEFEEGDDALYCIELVIDALKAGGLKLKPMVGGQYSSPLSKIAEKKAIHPMDILEQNFEEVFMSHNLAKDDEEKIYYVEGECDVETPEL